MQSPELIAQSSSGGNWPQNDENVTEIDDKEK